MIFELGHPENQIRSKGSPKGKPMADNPMWAICEHVAEVQALLDDHIAGGTRTAPDVVAKAQAVLSEFELLRAMSDVGYFPRTRRGIICDVFIRQL
jgi:hypothetical protein